MLKLLIGRCTVYLNKKTLLIVFNTFIVYLTLMIYYMNLRGNDRNIVSLKSESKLKFKRILKTLYLFYKKDVRLQFSKSFPDLRY